MSDPLSVIPAALAAIFGWIAHRPLISVIGIVVIVGALIAAALREHRTQATARHETSEGE
jgi:uncharacterized integral membrane protein